MFILGLILLLIGLFFAFKIFFWIGLILLIVGACVSLVGYTGHPVYGRRTWW